MAANVLELTAGADVVGLDAVALEADRLAIGFRPTKLAEGPIVRVVAHLDLLEAQGAGCGGEEKVLHAIVSSTYAPLMMSLRTLFNDKYTQYDDISLHRSVSCRFRKRNGKTR